MILPVLSLKAPLGRVLTTLLLGSPRSTASLVDSSLGARRRTRLFPSRPSLPPLSRRPDTRPVKPSLSTSTLLVLPSTVSRHFFFLLQIISQLALLRSSSLILNELTSSYITLILPRPTVIVYEGLASSAGLINADATTKLPTGLQGTAYAVITTTSDPKMVTDNNTGLSSFT